MPTYFILNKVIDPDTGYFDVAVPDNAEVHNILNEIWEECGDRLKETWPKLMRVDLQLYYLVDPIVGRDGGQGRVLREMAEYKNEKRLLDRLDRVASLPDLPEDHIVFELCVSSRVAPLRPETIVEQGEIIHTVPVCGSSLEVHMSGIDDRAQRQLSGGEADRCSCRSVGRRSYFFVKGKVFAAMNSP